MRPRHAVHLTPSVSLRLSQLPCYKQNEQSSFHSPYSLPSSASCKSFSCNTYEPPRKCCKQKAYDRAKSFSCNTYKKQGGHILQPKSFSLASPFPDVSTCRRSHVPSPILRTLFQVPYAASPVFATLTKTAGVWGYSSHFGTHPSISRDCRCHFRSVNSASRRLAFPLLLTYNLELTTYNRELLSQPLAFSSP